jgi:hypothetical protein
MRIRRRGPELKGDGWKRICCPITPTTHIRDTLPDAYDLWLNPGLQKADAICDLLKPFNADLMRRFEVSNRVNLVKNDDPACREPVVRVDAAAMP